MEKPKGNSQNKTWKILSIIGAICLTLLIAFFAMTGSKKSNIRKEIDKVDDKTTSKNDLVSKVVADVQGPNFNENWSQASRTGKAPQFTAKVINQKGVKLDYCPSNQIKKRLENAYSWSNPTPGVKRPRPPGLIPGHIYFSNTKNDPSIVPDVTENEEGKLEITLKNSETQSGVISQIDRIFPINETLRGKTIRLSVQAKADQLNPIDPGKGEKEIEKPQIKFRSIGEKIVGPWLAASTKVEIGDWSTVGGIGQIHKDAKFLNIRAQAGENYSLTVIPEIKVSIQKTQTASQSPSPTPKSTKATNPKKTNTQAP
jgi:hypothetical protein